MGIQAKKTARKKQKTFFSGELAADENYRLKSFTRSLYIAHTLNEMKQRTRILHHWGEKILYIQNNLLVSK